MSSVKRIYSFLMNFWFQDSAAFVRIWKKGDTMLFTGTVQISREASLARYKLDPMDNTTLVMIIIWSESNQMLDLVKYGKSIRDELDFEQT